MKLKRLLSILAILCVIVTFAANTQRVLKIYSHNEVIGSFPIAVIDSIKIDKSNPSDKLIKIYNSDNISEISVANIDSVKIEEVDTVALALAKEREALIAIYKALDGDNWTNNENWCSDKPVSEWSGVEVNEKGFITELWLNEGVSGVLPKEIKTLKSLRVLESSCNKLSGNPFDYIVYNVNLEQICFGDNDISGEIPNNISDLRNLKTLSIVRTKMYGELPSELFDCVNLEHLSISESDFFGEIPQNISNLLNLHHLTLSFCNFTGTILNKITNLTKLYNLDLNYCSFEGTIPIEFSRILDNIYDNMINRDNYIDTWWLRMGFNRFSGEIPNEIINHPTWGTIWATILEGNYLFNTTPSIIPAPKFNLFNMSNNRQSSDDYSKHNITMLYQWDHDINIHPYMSKIHDDFGNLGLNIIGLPMGVSTYDEVKQFVTDNNIKWDVCPLGIIQPWEDSSITNMNLINGQCFYPSNTAISIILINSEGKVIYYNLLNEYWSLSEITRILVNEFWKKTDYSEDGKVTVLQTASVGEGIDIVLMGDAYSDRQIADGTYKTDMEFIYNNLFIEEPYKSFKDYFNVYYVNVVSATEGYEYGYTALDGYFGGGTLVGGNDNAVFTYAQKAISAEQMDEALIIVAMNSDNYAGTCYMYHPESSSDYGNGISVSYFPKGGDAETFAALLHHEALGHGFAKLADEYAYEDMGAVPSDYVSQIQSQQSGWGWWKNVDFTSDTSAIRWNYFINDSRYQYDGLGAFEGGLTYWNGVWRPTENSIMRYNTGGFNAPSREAIYHRIHKLAYGDDWQYNYEDFVKYDEINRKTTPASSSVKSIQGIQKEYKPLHAPIVKKMSWREAK